MFYLNFFGKGKILGLVRDRMALSQEEMARALGVDALYLAQLEDGSRAVDEFFTQRAAELVHAFEKRNQ